MGFMMNEKEVGRMGSSSSIRETEGPQLADTGDVVAQRSTVRGAVTDMKTNYTTVYI